MIAPSPQYDPLNESQFRAQLEQDALRTVRTDRAAPFVLLMGDDDQVYKVSVVGGAPVATPV